MTEELEKALSTIIGICDSQDNCAGCPIEDICGLMPCDWV